ncbi:MAG TPA: hypothetical protein VMT62_03945 [Syntrophorhabdaceae bacterium]|nr:hypothetical protein [Syntrophorhabdaceae bacterium]
MTIEPMRDFPQDLIRIVEMLEDLQTENKIKGIKLDRQMLYIAIYRMEFEISKKLPGIHQRIDIRIQATTEIELNRSVSEQFVHIKSFTTAEVKNTSMIYLGYHLEKSFGKGTNSVNCK